MKIIELDPYKNSEGKIEKAPQYYFFQEYAKLPPQIRTTENLRTILLKKEAEGKVPFKIVSVRTLDRYKARFDWDKRIFDNLGRDTKLNLMETTDHFMNELLNDMLDYHQLTRKQKKKLKEWENTSTDDTEKVNTLNNIQKTYDQSFKTLHGTPISIAEMYAMLEVLKATEKSDDNKMDNIDKLLHDRKGE